MNKLEQTCPYAGSCKKECSEEQKKDYLMCVEYQLRKGREMLKEFSYLQGRMGEMGFQ